MTGPYRIHARTHRVSVKAYYLPDDAMGAYLQVVRP